MQPITVRASHIVAAVTSLALGGVLMSKPWTAQAQGSGAPVACAEDASARSAQAMPMNAMAPVPVNSAGQPAYAPQAYAPQASYATYPAQPIYAPQPAPRPTYVSQRRTASYRSENSRSWKRTALVIGGSASAGAGIGGLVGGKKGALIGAAIGGGGATLYEAVKR